MSNSSDSTNQADELRKLLFSHSVTVGQKQRVYGEIVGVDADLVDALEAYIAQAQQQLLRELMEQLPEKKYMHQFWEENTAEPPSRKEANREVTAVRNLTIDQVSSLLNKKLQAYGGE